jgi:hypothetical protein
VAAVVIAPAGYHPKGDADKWQRHSVQHQGFQGAPRLTKKRQRRAFPMAYSVRSVRMKI